MCGRFTLVQDPREINRLLAGLKDHLPQESVSRYNIAPTQNLIVVQGGILTQACWGLNPMWAGGTKLINARAESITTKPTFRDLFRERRCLILADGFYEWAAKGKQPIYFQLVDQELFAFAGLWDGEEELSSVIITTTANVLLAKYHHRMPVILPPVQYQTWLDPDQNEEALLALLKPYPAELMTARSVSKAVNSPLNDGPECLFPGQT